MKKMKYPIDTSVMRRIRCTVAAACAAALALPALAADLQHLTLGSALTLAMEHNRDVRLAAIAIDNAKAGVIIADAPPNPTLSIQTANINPHAGIGAGSLRGKTVDTTIRIDQLIERGGKRELRREAATHQEGAARADRDDAVRQVKLAVAQAYYDLLAAQERVGVADETARLFEQTLAAAQSRRKAGDLAGADVDRVTVDAMKARSDARQAVADLAKARIALAGLIGAVPQASVLHADGNWPDPAQSLRAASLDEKIEQRPDVKSARARLDAAIANRKLALASRTRDVSVGVQYEHYPSSDTNSAGSGNSYGVAVQIPLFVRYHYDGEIRAAEAAVDSARETLEKTREAARADAATAWSDLDAAAQRLRIDQDAALQAAGRAANAAEYAFKNGALGVMDVLDARRSYRAAQLDALSARADFAKSLAAWRASMMEDFDK